MRVIAIIVVLVAFAGESSSESRSKKKSVWRPLAQKGATWTLARKTTDGGGGKLTVTVTDVRKVGKADVARLDYACDPEGDCSNGSLPKQIAVTDRGAYLLGDDDDAAIGKALKKPAIADPPKAQKPTKRNELHFVIVPKQRKATYCVGESFDDCGATPCAAWLCVDETGVVGVGDLGGSGYVFGFEPDGITRG